MFIDRLLIACSTFELSYLALEQGFSFYTAFQWATMVLLLFKLAVFLDIARKR